MSKKPMTCLMCKMMPAKKLTAKQGDCTYVNAENVTIFCSVRCAANYGLLHNGVTNCSMHWCTSKEKWVPCADFECNEGCSK